MKESDILSLAGIIAEFNPFHNGHKYLIDCAKSDGHNVCAVISGNFVQRGDISVISKFERVKMALLNGVDIVCELPTPWAMSTAQNFAFGAVSQLNALGVDTIYFGSECGDINLLNMISDILESDEFSKKLKSRLSDGKTFASTRQEVLFEFIFENSKVLDGANDTLAVEYITAAKKINSSISFKAIKRIGPQHNDCVESGDFSTATLIREKIKSNTIQEVKKFIPCSVFNLLANVDISNINYIEKAILARLRAMTIEEFSSLPDISEGLENRLFASVKNATTLEDLYDMLKSKRYTHARIRRLILNAFIGVDNTWFKTEPPYVRILGFRGDCIKHIDFNTNKPIITKVSEIKNLSQEAKRLFELECRATDIYSLSFNKPKKCGAEFTTPIIKV